MEQMAGRTVSLSVEAVGIKQKIKPELDDDFAKKVRPDVESVADLRKFIKDDIRHRMDGEIRDQLERQVGDLLVEANPFDLPDSMIDMQANLNLRNMAQRFAGQGMKLEDIFPDIEALRKENRASSEKVVRVALLVDAIAKELNLEIGEADIDKEIEELAARYQVPADMVKQNMLNAGGFEEMKFGLLERKVFDYIVENSDVEEVDKLEEDADDAGTNGSGADE
ncbi:MAG: Trigger factor [Deltaproteobacteria bacterium ADurb.Bin510]|nr:MAG: Trigger factor [Deltaproteobacteria bacterium ADurb.Bin510]